MTITKFGHSCLLVEEPSSSAGKPGVRILTDPGSYSSVPADLDRLDAILLTHEHGDHCDVDTLRALRAKNPTVTIVTNHGVGAVLTSAEIPFTLLEDSGSTSVRAVTVEAFGTTHASLGPSIPPMVNTGYLIAGRIFLPGDAFTVPPKPVEILALPIAAPWSKISETLDYALAVKPRLVIPIHDGFLTERNPYRAWLERTLPEHKVTVSGCHPAQPMEV